MSKPKERDSVYGLSEMTCRKYGPQEDGSYRMKAWQSARGREREKGATRFRVRALYQSIVLEPCRECELRGLPVGQCAATRRPSYVEGVVTVVETRWESRREGDFAYAWESLELCNLMVYASDNPEFSRWLTLVESSVRRDVQDKNPFGLASLQSRCPHKNNQKKVVDTNGYGIVSDECSSQSGLPSMGRAEKSPPSRNRR